MSEKFEPQQNGRSGMIPAMLEKFCLAKQEEIEKLLVRGGGSFHASKERNAAFSRALREQQRSGKRAIIAEYKRSSPSLGAINLQVEPEEAAQSYAENGACALSILTEERYFSGHMDYLKRAAVAGLPLLRKDFIFHPLQIAQTAESCADAVLVIVRTLDDPTLEQVLEACHRYQLEAVVEVFSKEDLERAQRLSASIIQVNNRDLDTLKTDLDTSRSLIAHKREGELWISASGFGSYEPLQEMEQLGFDAFLIGSSLMGSSELGKALAALVNR